jgi:hypothetical protein
MGYRVPSFNKVLNYKQKKQAAIILEMVPAEHFKKFRWAGLPRDTKELIHMLEIAEVFIHDAPESFKNKLASRIEGLNGIPPQ